MWSDLHTRTPSYMFNNCILQLPYLYCFDQLCAYSNRNSFRNIFSHLEPREKLTKQASSLHPFLGEEKYGKYSPAQNTLG